MIQPLLNAETKTAPGPAVFEYPGRTTDMKSSDIPLSPWTPEHRITSMIRTPDSVMTCDEPIRCPSSWTPDHWMNAISQNPGITYDEPIRCPSLDAGCHWIRVRNPLPLPLDITPKRGEPHAKYCLKVPTRFPRILLDTPQTP